MCPKIVISKEVCLACLTKRRNMKLLQNHIDDSHELIKKFTSLLHLEAAENTINNQFPCYLCCECEEKLDISFKFQQLCQQSFQFIITHLGNTVISKIDDMPDINLPNIKEEMCDNFASLEHSTVEEFVDNDTNRLDSKQNTEETRKSSSKQVMKLTQYPHEEVNSVITMIRENLWKQQNCVHCNFTAKGPRSLSFHMSRIHQEYKEKWCSKCNQSVANLSEHKKTKHKEEFRCHFCGKIFDNTSHLLEHLACHTVDRKFVCEICDKCFISARHLRAHSKVHSPKKKYSCLVCSLTVRTKQSLIAHMKLHKLHKCKVCEDIFEPHNYESHNCFTKTDAEANGDNINKKSKKQSEINYDSLDVFNSTITKKVEDTEMKALCIYCGKKFRTLSKLSVHVRVHTGETPYQCSYCDARMTTRTHLVVHERTHTGEKPYVCNICGKGFAQSSVLGTHKKIHTGRTEQCSLCPKKFCRPSELKQHMRKHTGEKPFLCEYCDKAFVQRSHLVEHLWTHTDDRRFKCEFCKKGFRQASTLKTHLDIHLGKKSFKCSKCPYASRQSYSLQQHSLQHEEPKEISYTCELCELTFENMASFTSHCSTEHEVITFSEEEKSDLVHKNVDNEQQNEILQLLY